MENGKKKLSKKQLSVLISAISVIVIAAVVICIFIINGKDNKGDVSGDASGDAAISELATDEATGDDTASDEISETGGTSENNQSDSTNNGTSSDSSITKDEENEYDSQSEDDYDDTEFIADLPEDVTIVEKTEEKDKWPADKIPNSVPACKYVSLDRCSIQDDGNQKVWFMSWVSSISDYEAWLNALKTAGFKESVTMPGRYANGSEIVDVYTEDDTDSANYWVSVEIYTSTPIDYKSAPLDGVFPEFNKGDSTLQYWVSREDSGKFICQYAGSQNWEGLLNAYMSLLEQNGFTVENYTASKTVNGKVYSVYLKGEQISSEEMIVYMY